MNIRNATEDDIPALLQLYAQLEFDADYTPTLTPEKARGLFQRIARYPDYTIYIAEAGGEMVGTFALLIMDNLEHDGAPSGIIEAVVVRPDCQGQGIGKAMMAFAMDRCREKSCCKVMLSSNARREQAHRFYESIGFEKHGYSFLTKLSVSCP